MKISVFFRILLFLLISHTILYKIGLFAFANKISIFTLLSNIKNSWFYVQVTASLLTLVLTTSLLLPLSQRKFRERYVDYWSAVFIGTIFMCIHIKIMADMTLTFPAIIGYKGMYMASYRPLIETILMVMVFVVTIYFYLGTKSSITNNSSSMKFDYNIYLLMSGLAYSLQYIPINTHLYRYLTTHFDLFLASSPIYNTVVGIILTLVMYAMSKKIFSKSAISEMIFVNNISDLDLKIILFYSLIPASILNTIFAILVGMKEYAYSSAFSQISKLLSNNSLHLVVAIISSVILFVLVKSKDNHIDYKNS